MNDVQLSGALRTCSLHALLLITAKALSKSGYGDVQFLDRRQPRDKSRFGGHDLICETVIGPRLHRVVVKVLRDSVRIRHLDELAGTVIRMGADSGLLVTPWQITKKAETLLEAYGPVRTGVIDGHSLVRWLTELGIGTRGKDEVDYGYFGELEEVANRVEAFLACLA